MSELKKHIPWFFVLILLSGFFYYILKPKSSDILLQKTTSSNDQLFQKQQACSQLLNDFETRTIEHTKNNPALSEDYLSKVGGSLTENNTDFVIGYSPTLDSCVGGYTYNSTRYYAPDSTPNSCPDGSYIGNTCVVYSKMFVIVNLNTNQTIPPLYGLKKDFKENDVEYRKYKTELSALTNGQIQWNN